MDIVKVANSFAKDFCDTIWVKLKNKGVKGIGITGSFARGDYSKSRLQINFAIFIESPSPNLLLDIGKITSNLNSKYSQFVNLRPDYHPERIVYPWERNPNKSDLLFKIAFFNLREKGLPRPFGRPGYVIEGHKTSAKMLYGENYFKDIKISSSNEEVADGVLSELAKWSREINITPLSYNLVRDTDLFFDEALGWGKIAVMHYAWMQGIKNGFDYSLKKDRLKVFDKIHNKEKLKEFIILPKRERVMLNLILDARLNYEKWKNNKNIANKLYFSSSHLINYFLKKTVVFKRFKRKSS